MRINYFYINKYGRIFESVVDTDDENYVSHTDSEVTFKDTYMDMYDEIVEDVVTHSRLFETVRQKRIAAYKEEIARYQKELAVFENNTSYEQYKKLMNEV